jgi:hypothetical protein
MDAAASRVGASLPLYVLVEEARKRKAEEERQAKADNPSKKERSAPLVFLEDNIGRLGESTGESEPVHVTQDEEDDVMSDESEFVLSDDTDELRRLSEEQRLSTFQSQYKLQIDRQEGLLQLDETDPVTSPQREDEEDRSIIWEECELESRGFIPK